MHVEMKLKDLDGNSGEIRECIKVMPDGRRVKERTVTSYEDLDEPVIQTQQSQQVRLMPASKNQLNSANRPKKTQ